MGESRKEGSRPSTATTDGTTHRNVNRTGTVGNYTGRVPRCWSGVYVSRSIPSRDPTSALRPLPLPSNAHVHPIGLYVGHLHDGDHPRLFEEETREGGRDCVRVPEYMAPYDLRDDVCRAWLP